MSQYLLLPLFKRQMKRLKRRYKTHSFVDDVSLALSEFIELSDEQKRVLSIGHYQYKVRVKSGDLKKGKRGGFRILLLLALPKKGLFLPFAIYSKSDFDALPLSLKNAYLAKVRDEFGDWLDQK